MFLHNFKYSLKVLFKNKVLIFWTLAFPLIMGTFFNLAFKDIISNNKLNVFDIAIVKDGFDNNYVYKEVFNTLSDKDNPDRLFNIKYTTVEEAKELLEEDKIVGYLEIKDKPILTFTNNGINQTILKYVVDEISDINSVIGNMTNPVIATSYQIDYQSIYQEVSNMVSNNNIKICNELIKIITSKKNSY